MGRPKGSTKENLESRWYDVFSGWTKADREAALRVLMTLHRHLPEAPTKANEDQPETGAQEKLPE